MSDLFSAYYMRVLSAALLLISFAGAAGAEDELEPSIQSTSELPEDLTEIGLEALLNFDLVVTSPGKKKQQLSDVASAVFVLSNEDIRRSGVTHIAEALRLVPGMNVARISSNKWAVSARGFNQLFANKLLVLLDGVSIYSPTTNGVYWETNELMLEDIDRIEVIRGPGASLWGANAVNGVVNIISKSANQTQGLLAAGGGGSHEQGFGTLRYGGQIGERTAYRFYGRFSARGENELEAGGDADDDWNVTTAGFRVDSTLSERDRLIAWAKGQYYDAEKQTSAAPSLEPPFIDNEPFSGLETWWSSIESIRWIRDFAGASNVETELNHQFFRRTLPVLDFQYHVYNAQSEYRFTPHPRHDIIVGAGYRFFRIQSVGSFAETLEPSSRSTDLYTAFVQDEISLIGESLKLILGSKFEKNAYTGFEYMPTARLYWAASPKTAFWTAVSRAVAPPALAFEDDRIPLAAFPSDDEGNVGIVGLRGSRSLESEDLTAFELGARHEFPESVSVDLALFYNLHHDIFSFEEREPFFGTINENQPMPSLVLPLEFDNNQAAESWGAELAVQFNPTPTWQLIGTYSFININVTGTSSDETVQNVIEGSSPENQFSIRSLLDLPHRIELDSVLRYVDRLTEGDVDSYFELDLRLGFQPAENVRLSIVGQNLLNDSHKEFVGNFFGPPPIEIERGVYGKLTLTY